MYHKYTRNCLTLLLQTKSSNNYIKQIGFIQLKQSSNHIVKNIPQLKNKSPEQNFLKCSFKKSKFKPGFKSQLNCKDLLFTFHTTQTFLRLMGQKFKENKT